MSENAPPQGHEPGAADRREATPQDEPDREELIRRNTRSWALFVLAVVAGFVTGRCAQGG